MNSWQKIPVTLKLESPLHIGYLPKKAGMVLNPTLSYVPSKMIWGAITTAILNRNKPSDREAAFKAGAELGASLKKLMIPSYFYIWDDTIYYTPSYLCACPDSDGVFKWGKLSDQKFRQKFLAARVMTAIDPTTHTAKDAHLYEIESIQHQINVNECIKPVYLVGVVWVNQEEIKRNEVFELKENALLYKGESIFKDLVLGGEQRVGMGRTSFAESNSLPDISIFPDNPKEITLESNRPILYHVATDNLEDHLFYGDIDPLADKQWNEKDKKPEATIRHFFAPGTQFTVRLKLRLDELGRGSEIENNE